MHIPVYGLEHTFLEKDTELLYRHSSLKETAPLHTHTFYEFFVVTEGSALHMVNNAVQTLSKGDLLFIRAQDTHCYDFYHSDNFYIQNIGFSNQLLQRIRLFLGHSQNLQALLESDLPPCFHLTTLELQEVSSAFKKIGDMLKTAPPQSTTSHAQCYLALLFTDYFFDYPHTSPFKSELSPWFEAMLTQMQKLENLQEGFSKMLALSPCSKNHLCRLFKSKLNVTPTQYINNNRLNYSIYLLIHTDWDILEISETCGFNNLSHFYHLFKAKYACSPALFRKSSK